MSTTTVSETSRMSFKSPSGVIYSFEEITPEIAESMLARNTRNRKIRTRGVDQYARDIENGDWKENGDAIRFDADGVLIDGQHRLTAIVAAGAAVWCLIIRGLTTATQLTVDSGIVRPMSERFEFNGVNNSKTAAAITRRILMWQNGQKSNAGGNYQPTVAEMLEAWRTDPLIRSATEAAMQMKGRKQIPASVIGLTWWLFSQIDTEECSTFWSGLYSGSELAANSPIHVVRERIIKQNAQPGRVPESIYLAWTIKAWNLWRAGKHISPNYRGFDFRVGERFPEPR